MPDTHTAKIYDRRTVKIRDLPAGCISYTPKGNVPIRCSSVELTYDIPSGELGSVLVGGHLIDEADIKRRANGYRTGSAEDRDSRARWGIERGYRVDWSARPKVAPLAPGWLVELIEQYRPGGDSHA